MRQAIALTLAVLVVAGWRYLLPRYTGDALELRRLARSYGIIQTRGFRAEFRREVLKAKPRPRIKVKRRPDGQHDLWIYEPHDATAKTTEPMTTFWARFVNDFERGTGAEWVIEDNPGDRWKRLHPALPLPDPGQLERPENTLRHDNPLLIPAGVFRNDLGQLEEPLIDLEQSNLAIGGAPGTGKTGFTMHVVSHLVEHQAGPVELLDPKRVTWPKSLRDHPGIESLATDPDLIYERLVHNQTVMMARYTEAEDNDEGLGPTIARDGHRFIVIGELGELLAIFAARKKPPKGSPDLEDFIGAEDVVAVAGSIARLGREAGVHLIADAQSWNARQFGGTELRGLFMARVAGWLDKEQARMLDLPDAVNLPIRQGRPLAGRFVLAREGRLPVRYQAYYRTRDELADVPRARSGRLAPPDQQMPSASRPSRPRPPSFLGRGGGAARAGRSASGQGTSALAGPNVREVTEGSQDGHEQEASE